MFRNHVLGLSLGIGMCVTSAATAVVEYTAALVVQEGEQALDAPPGAVFAPGRAFQLSMLGNGDVVFAKTLQQGAGGINFTNDRGVWMGQRGSVSAIAKGGDIAPGVPGNVPFAFGFDIKVNEAGQYAITATLDDTVPGIDNTNNRGIWYGEAGQPLTLLARDGDSVPSVPGATYDSLRVEDIDSFSGQVLMSNTLTVGVGGVTSSNNDLIMVGTPGNVQTVFRQDDPAPGTSGLAFDQFTLVQSTPVGDVAVSALTSASFNNGIWFGPPNNPSLVAKTGDPAPELRNGAVFDFVSHLAVNGPGQMIFQGGELFAAVNTGVFFLDGGSRSLILQEGEAIPGVTSSMTYSGSPFAALNEAGRYAMTARVDLPSGATENAMLINDPAGGFTFISLSGVDTDTLPSGARFSSYQPSFVDDSDTLLIYAGLEEGFGGITPANNEGLWLYDDVHGLQKIFQKGDLFDINPDPLIDDLHAITAFSFGHVDEFNRLPVSFELDGAPDGVYILTLVPEPSALALLALGSLAMLRRQA